MAGPYPVVVCDSAELLVDLKIALQSIRFDAQLSLVESDELLLTPKKHAVSALLTTERIEAHSLIDWVAQGRAPSILCSLDARAEDHGLAADLGIVSCTSPRVLAVALRMLSMGNLKPWIASARKLKKA